MDQESGVLLSANNRDFHVFAHPATIGPLEDIVFLQLPASWELAAFSRNRFSLYR